MGHPRPLGDILRTGVRHVQSCPRCNPVDWAATPGPPHAGPVCDRVHHVRSGPGCTGLACVHAGPVRDTSLGVAHHVWVHWEEATLRSAHMARPHLRLWSTVYTHLGLGVCTSDFMSAPRTSCPHLGLASWCCPWVSMVRNRSQNGPLIRGSGCAGTVCLPRKSMAVSMPRLTLADQREDCSMYYYSISNTAMGRDT